MPTTTKHTLTEKGFGPTIISSKVESHANDPFVIQKVAKVAEVLKKVGLPNTNKK